MNTIKFDKKNVKVIAHRGLSGIETENTNSAFVAAGNRSYYGIETDIHVTPDEKFIVIHDELTVRVSDTVVNVEETPYDELRKIRLKNICKYDGEGLYKNDVRGDILLPNLAEYVGICRKYEKKCILELKRRFETKHIKMVVEELKALNYVENVVFISFDFDNLIDLRALIPDAEIQYLVYEYDADVREKLKKYNFELDIKHTALSPEVIDEVHSDGHKVNCWTVDNKDDGERLANWGVDYITTNILE